MPQLNIIKMGHPNLRKEAKLITADIIKSTLFQKFVDDLIFTMRKANGAGIAAPQVDALDRIFIMEMTENPRYPNKESFPLIVAINPTIKPLSDEKVDSWEGCLSIPGIRGRLLRYKNIRLMAQDRLGIPYEKELEGFAAIVAQHELDHLDGKLFIDRMDSMRYLAFESEYEQYFL